MVLSASFNHTSAIHSPAVAAVAQGFSAPTSAPAELSLAERKLGMLKRTGLFGENLKGCTIQRACTAEDLRQAYRLVHDVYLGSGFIKPDPSGMRVRMFETTPDTATFVAKVKNTVVAVLSVVEDSRDLGLPSDCVFKPELDGLRRNRRRLCEVTNQAVAEEYRKSAVPTELMRCAIAVSLTEGYDEALAAVSPSHHGFYDLLGFRQIGSERSYSQTIDDPVIAVSMDIDQYRTPKSTGSATVRFMRQFLTDGNQFLSRVTGWAQEARRNFLNPDLLKKLFAAEKNFLAKCSSAELEILHRRWGHELFVAVTGDMYFPKSASSSRNQLAAKENRFAGLGWLTPFALLRGSTTSSDIEEFVSSNSARTA
jgi:ribosomal protein S18 acetylase RimI-like enzyme